MRDFMFIAQQEPPSTNIWALERTPGPILSQPLFWTVIGAILVTTLLLILIARVPSNFRKPIVVAVTFVCALYYILEWLIPKARTADGQTVQPFLFGFNWLDVQPIASSTSQILSAFLLILGVISIFRVHFGRVFRKHKDWFFSGVLLLTMFVMIFFGMASWRAGKALEVRQAEIAKASREGTINESFADLARLASEDRARTRFKAKRQQIERQRQEGTKTQEEAEAELATEERLRDEKIAADYAMIDQSLAAGVMSPEVAALARAGARVERDRLKTVQMSTLMFRDMLQVLEAAMFSLIAFFILSAAFRAFRIRSVEATILMFTALIVLMSFVPLGLALTSGLNPDAFVGNFRIDAISDWILSTLNTPAIRAINLGLALGVLAMGTRIMLGLEKGVAE